MQVKTADRASALGAIADKCVLVAGLVLSLLPGVSLAQGRPPACDLGDYDATHRPDPEGTPTEVTIGVSILRVDRVDNIDESFYVWEPSIVIFNRRDTSLELPDVVTVDSEGHVRYIQRIQSTLLAPMDLRDFPLDAQRLPLTMVSFKHGPEDVTLSLDEMAATRQTDLSIAGWVQLLDRCGSVERAGVTWTIHTDAPVSPLGALHMIRVAVVRDLWKEPDTVLAPQERVGVEAAIRSVTRNAAWLCHSEGEIGSLEPGKLADLVVLESDPRKVEPRTISDIKVDQTWMDGRQVYGD